MPAGPDSAPRVKGRAQRSPQDRRPLDGETGWQSEARLSNRCRQLDLSCHGKPTLRMRIARHAYLIKPHHTANPKTEGSIMTNSFQPAEDIFDDVEGHMPRIKLPVEAEETDEVEGHGTLRAGVGERRR